MIVAKKLKYLLTNTIINLHEECITRDAILSIPAKDTDGRAAAEQTKRRRPRPIQEKGEKGHIRLHQILPPISLYGSRPRERSLRRGLLLAIQIGAPATSKAPRTSRWPRRPPRLISFRRRRIASPFLYRYTQVIAPCPWVLRYM